jgi:protein gp37
MARRLQGMGKRGYEGLVDEQGRWMGQVNLLEWRMEDPLHLKQSRRIAVNLMGDLFHPEVPTWFIQKTFNMMVEANWHTFFVLTKRPERMLEILPGVSSLVPPWNVWLGTTAGTQQSANDRRISMMQIHLLGWKTWVSCEPQLEMIDWHGWSFLKWMVVGGESGPRARPMSPAWARADRDWCQDQGVKFWFKQWGEWGPAPLSPSAISPHLQSAQIGGLENYSMTMVGEEMMFRFGRKQTGRLLDDQEWSEE